MSIEFAVAGAAGRMGRRIVALAAGDRELTCVGAIESAGSLDSGADIGELAGIGRNGIAIRARPERPFDVLVDFSSPEGTLQCLEICREARRPIVIGTTGHDAAGLAAIKKAAGDIPVFHSPNMSVGVNVVLRAVRQIAESLDDSYDVEISEVHHRFKADAPSGTALALRNAVCAGRRATLPVVHGRQGRSGERPRGEIGMHALRMGDVVGRHIVSFGTIGETISVEHNAHSRDTFAAGALRAAKWIVGRPAGIYDMQNLLFGATAES